MKMAIISNFKQTKTEGFPEPSANEWPTLSLREAGISLIDCDHRTPPASENGYPYVAIPQIKNGHIDLADARHITREHFLEWTHKAHPEAYDVVLSRRCNPGETAFVPPGLEFAVGQNLVLLRSNGEKVFPPFLRWLVRSPEWWGQVSKFINVGAIFDSLKCADIPNFTLHIPPLPEQRAITYMLDSVDDKIELNNQMNKTLEAIGRVIFKHWFIDFEFPNEEGKPYKSSDGEMAYNEELVKEIPKGWEVSTLGNFISVLETGSRPKGGVKHIEDGIPSVGAESITGIADFDFSETKFVDIGFFESMTRGRVEDGDVLLYKDGGRPGEHPGKKTMVDRGFPFEKFCINEHVYRLRVQAPLTQHYLYLWLDTPFATDQIIQRATGVAQPGINREAVERIPILVSLSYLISVFTTLVRPLFNRMFENSKQSRSLALIRDSLLPKLMSGKIRVPVEVR